MKNLKRIILIVFLAIVLIYISNITSIPDSIILFKGEELNLFTVYGLKLKEDTKKYETVETYSKIANNEIIENKKVKISLFNLIDLKTIEVKTIPETTVVPVGNLVGLKLYTSGVLVVGMTEIEGQKPYENTGIQEGDMIVKINEQEVTCTSELINSVNNSKGSDLSIKYIRDGIEYTTNIEPIKTQDNKYKIGLWVRDGAAGIGTITYYEPSTKQYAALGHGIVDIDTLELINISSGELVTSKIVSIIKGEKSIPR